MQPKSSKFWVVDKGQWTMAEGIVEKRIPPGLYELKSVETMMGTHTFLRTLAVTTDTVTTLPESLCFYVTEMVKDFWGSQDRYTKMGLLHKRGLLLEGEPGCGKTVLCLLVGQEVGKQGGIALFTSPKTNIDALPPFLQRIRETHPATPIVNIMEDIDEHSEQMHTVLSLLDGENQVSNILHLATTNYLEQLDARLINRPSRFDEIINVGAPNKNTRWAYFESILPKDFNSFTFEELVIQSEGLNFAQLKELAISTYVFARPIAQTVARLREMEETSDAFEEQRNEIYDPNSGEYVQKTRKKRRNTTTSLQEALAATAVGGRSR